MTYTFHIILRKQRSGNLHVACSYKQMISLSKTVHVESLDIMSLEWHFYKYNAANTAARTSGKEKKSNIKFEPNNCCSRAAHGLGHNAILIFLFISYLFWQCKYLFPMPIWIWILFLFGQYFVFMCVFVYGFFIVVLITLCF